MLLTKSFLNELVQKGTLNENLEFSRRQVRDEYDVFISYSWHDRSYADKVVQLLELCGYSVYIDYKDTRLDRNNVSEATAQKLIQVMRKCKEHTYMSRLQPALPPAWELRHCSPQRYLQTHQVRLPEFSRLLCPYSGLRQRHIYLQGSLQDTPC